MTGAVKASVVDGKSIAAKIRSLSEKHDEIQVSVAWATRNSTSEYLLTKHREKISLFVVGISFFQTQPELLRSLLGIKGAFVVEPKNNVFHPKAYYFSSGKTAEAIVGSSNFTGGGLGRNTEINLHIKGHRDDQAFKDLRNELQNYRKSARPVRQGIVDDYQCQFDSQPQRNRIEDPKLELGAKERKQLRAPLVKLGWPQYSKLVRETDQHMYGDRLELLRESQVLFHKATSFRDLSRLERQALAGTMSASQCKANGRDWAIFGSMRGAGDFKNLVNQNSSSLADAIDCIPRSGEVGQKNFIEFRAKFAKAFEPCSRKGATATASRLLAMKRPDSFVCVSSPNTELLSEALDFPKSNLKHLDSYWDHVIEPIRRSSWYRSVRPQRRLAELWDYRAAMLDSIYYKP